MSKKRSREEGNVDTQLVEIFEDLASDTEAVRVKAAKVLVGRLSNEPEIHDKVLNRLFRGLASGRKSARLGFSIVLTEVLRMWTTILEGKSELSLAGVIDLLEANTKISKDAKGQESRDYYLGRVFGAAAIVQSGVLFADRKNAPFWERLIHLLFETSKQKSWIREECGWVVYQSVKTLKSIPSGEEYVRNLLEYIAANGQAKTPEGVAVWIAAQQEFPDLKLPKGVFRHQDPLTRKEKGTLARVLKQSSVIEQTTGDAPQATNGATSGSWSSKPHFAWDVVFTAALQPAKKQVTFAELWREAVDESLFSLKSSPERKYWGFLLFQKYVLSAPGSVIPCLFGSNLLGTLKYQLRSDEQSLNAMAVDVVDAIVARSLEDSEVVPELVFGFLNADINFDRFAKAKPVEKLVGRASLPSLKRIVLRIIDEIEQMAGREEEEDRHGLTSLADILVSTFRSHHFPDSIEELEQYRKIVNVILGTFVQQAFTESKTTQATRDIFKQRLMSSLNHITAKDPQPALHPCNTVTMIRRGVGKNQLDAEPSVLEAIEKGSKLLEKVQAKESTGKDAARGKTLQAFELLLAFALLQAYSEEAESVNTIDDLQNCYRSLIKDKSTTSEEEDAVALIEIIVEFISKPSALYRRLAPKILSAFSSRVTEEGLDVMLKVLNTSENTSGQAELFANGEEEADAMDVDGDSNDSSLDSDVEVVDAEGSEGSEAEDDESASSAASDGASPEADADAELEAFDAQLAAALGTRLAEGDAEADGSDSDSDSDMSDGAMEALDDKLGEIFKQRREAGRGTGTSKQQRRGARDTIVNFKTKILELLEAYVKLEYASATALHLVAPLLQSMHATTSPPIAQKSCELIRTFTRLYKLRPVEELAKGRAKKEKEDEEKERRAAAFALLEETHALVHDTTSAMQAKACTSASLLGAKVYLSHGGKLEEVTKLYEKTKTTLRTEGEGKFRTCFVEDYANWRTQAGKNGQLKGR